MGCERCGLYSKVIRGFGKENSKILILGDVPSYYDDHTGEAFSGAIREYIRRELDIVGINLDDCYMTKVIKCYTTSKPKTSEIKACVQNLVEEVQRIKPKYILALGSVALQALTGSSNLTKARAKIFEWQGCKCLATYNPKVVIAQPMLEYEFRADLNYFARMTEDVWDKTDDFKWINVQTKEQLDRMLKDIQESRELVYDIETNSLKHDGKLIMIGIATPHMNYVIPVETEFNELGCSYVKGVLSRILLKRPKGINIAQNGKFDDGWLRSRGIRPWLDFDTYLASYCLNVNLPHDLKYNAKVEFGAKDYEADIDYKEPDTIEEYMKMAEYCAYDVYYTLKWYYRLKQRLLEDQRLARVFKYIVMPGSRVLEDIEEAGVYVDLERLKTTRDEYKKIAENARLEAIALCGEDINFNSPKQLAKVLYQKLKLPVIKESATGQPSTDKGTLLRLAEHHPLPKKILEFRNADKSVGTFLNPWEELLEKEVSCGREPRLYPKYNIGVTATGRLSCNDPNLQQVPKDKAIRSLISSPEGWVFVEADMSQIELRIAAFIAGAESMKSIYRTGGDLHRRTASQVSGVSEADVTKPMRSRAKPVNFGYLYGMFWKSFKDYAFVSYGVTFTDEEAEHSRNAYFEAYPELLPWHERQKTEVRTFKCVRSPLGRIRHLPNIDSPDRDLRGEAERQAINTPVQSMASDITLLNMIMLNDLVPKDKAFMVGQVHDAMLWQVREDYVDTLYHQIKDVAEKKVPQFLKEKFGVALDLPLVIDVSVSKEGWGLGEEL